MFRIGSVGINPRGASWNLRLAIVPAAFFSFCSAASAGTIFLSGDTNIVNPLAGSFGASPNAGNQHFFRNVLGAGSRVLVLENLGGGTSISTADNEVNSFYNGLLGVSSSIFSGEVTADALAGVDLLFSALPDDPFSSGEVAALSDFLLGGGTLFLAGENLHGSFAPANAAINDVLAGLGSSLFLFRDAFDTSFFHHAGSGQILPDNFTTGVETLDYVAPSQVRGGSVLFIGTGGQPFLSYESTRTAVPEPGTLLLLLGAGLIALYRRHRE